MRIFPVSLLLIALLVLMGQSVAMARGAPGPAGQMVLCTGTGPVMVFVDGDGQPTEAPRFCPDTAMGLLSVVAIAAAEASFTADPGHTRTLPRLVDVVRAKPVQRRLARAPPLIG